MHIGIDIDGTIAGRNMNAFTAACNQQFGLDLPTHSSLSYKALLAHPIMQAQRRDAPERFEETLTRLELAPEMLRMLPALPGAVQGVQFLNSIGSIGYYTVRKALPPFTSSEVEAATRAWLAEHDFLCAQRVSFCWSLMNKLLHAYQYLHEHQEPMILIDDLAPELLTAWTQLREGQHPRLSVQEGRQIADDLSHFLTLVAFGRSQFPGTNSQLRVVPLATWEHVAALIPSIVS